MKRSFIDARIDAMLGACERHGVASAAVRAMGRGAIIAPSPPPRARIPEGGLGWNVVEFKPGEFATSGPHRVHAADGRLAPA